MPLNVDHARRHLAVFDLETLFVEELGWDHYSGRLGVTVDEITYTLRGIVEKRGMAVFVVETTADGLPDHLTRRKIEREAAKSVHEHLIVYADAERTTQVWQWVRREPGRPMACRELRYKAGQSGEALIQRLDAITFTLDEEADVTIVDVTRRARAAFDVERVTKRFYDLFKTEHDGFLALITGLEKRADLEWYASVMLNRLMFVYFIQKKGFLDGDREYLRNRLERMRQSAGHDTFLTFYRHFLLRLFHEGLGRRERGAELDELIGDVPYLNGGLFDVHALERENPAIQIPDEAFERVFDFFDAWQWHLDDRRLRSDSEVNPDVLGYIFEKYINQKQMGAYYTKEDITHYITASTVLPCLLDRVELAARELGVDTHYFWALLRSDPRRYLSLPLAHGADVEVPLDAIAWAADPLDPRGNEFATGDFALPNETWRELVRRRRRAESLVHDMECGEVTTVDSLVTKNLNLSQWAQDVVETCDSPMLLRQIFESLEKLSVLDPTCGSGAFLFSALNILEPLYEATLDRMNAFLDAESTPGALREWFAATISDVERHPNARFFILKKIVVNNLYGVDVMEEAVEICKLRLFLKLVAQIDRADDIEPLPDIDFNIRAGNTLVGFVDLKDAERAVLGGEQTRLDISEAMDAIAEKSQLTEEAFETFHRLQLASNSATDVERAGAKLDLGERLSALRSELDGYLASEYGVASDDAAAFRTWRQAHQPFHWLTEFFGLMRSGGFDVIIGNPPYLEVSKLAGQYRPLNFRTEAARDIYAWVVERTFQLRRPDGRIGLIVPISIASSASFAPLRAVVVSGPASLWLSHYANRPAQLFSGAQNRLSILLCGPKVGEPEIHSTRYHRWDAKQGERETLFGLLEYVRLDEETSRGFHGLLAKVGTDDAVSVLKKLASTRTLGGTAVRISTHPVYWVRVPGYFCQFFLRPPMARPEGGGAERPRGELNKVYLTTEETQRIVHAVLNSSTYYQFYVAYSDGRHINPSDVQDFPLDTDELGVDVVARLVDLSHRLDKETALNTTQWRKSGLLIDSLDSRPLKPLIDEIDIALASHYGFTDAELDQIINFDFKYRVGSE